MNWHTVGQQTQITPKFCFIVKRQNRKSELLTDNNNSYRNKIQFTLGFKQTKVKCKTVFYLSLFLNKLQSMCV